VRRLEATWQPSAKPDSPLTPRQEEIVACLREARASPRSLPSSSLVRQRSGSTSSGSTACRRPTRADVVAWAYETGLAGAAAPERNYRIPDS
jgi:hypothetical protein